ncbi:MAG: hypothetical protein HY663_05065 [Chloroflexi bacterium]|nr:hypothetical protein [Chloroflexota bacterium]
MKKRIIWLVVSCLMVLSLVLASCAPKAAETPKVTEEKVAVTEEKKPATEEKKPATVKEVATQATPQYGGRLNVSQSADPRVGFTYGGQSVTSQAWRWALNLTNEFLASPDRTKGPLGTKQWKDFMVTAPGRVPVRHEFLTGLLAESWERPDANTFKLKIRKGVHWQNKAPANGAEMTPEDVLYNFQLWWGRPGSPISPAYPYLARQGTPEEVAKAVYLDPEDPWTVIVNTKVDAGAAFERFAMTDYIVPKALGPIDGIGFGTWRGVVGTGPFYLTDYVSGSSLTYEKNPNYWRTDALYPQNRLPYVDSVKVFIIPDVSTRMAALRTGKLDILESLGLDDAETLRKTNPELLWGTGFANGRNMQMRNDVKPFDNVNVRRAMMMAIDQESILKDFYKGQAIKFYGPVYPSPEHKELWIPLEEMPRSVQDLYEYHPDTAAKLLDEAGYPGPKRFTTSIVLDSGGDADVNDLMAIVASYWAKLGVTLNLDIKDSPVYAAMLGARSYPTGIYRAVSGSDLTKFQSYKVGGPYNQSNISDPKIEEWAEKVGPLYFDMPGMAKLYKGEKIMEYLHSNAFLITLPTPYTYTFWQPWVGGYAGEVRMNLYDTIPSVGAYVWIDQNLRKAMSR